MIGLESIWIYLFVIAGLLSLIRAGLGPTFADRYLGIGAFINIVTLLVVVYAIQFGNQFFLDIAMLLVMMSFVGSLAIAKYAPKKDTPLKMSMKAEKPRRDTPLKMSMKAEKPRRDTPLKMSMKAEKPTRGKG
jgi:multicomponent Na+:H+ antiporter subunit F